MLAARAPAVTSVHDMVRWTAEAATLVDAHGRATPALQKLLLAVEPLFAKLAPRARMVFTDLAAHTGASLKDNSAMPMRRVPYWQKEVHPLANYQSSPSLPKEADVVIVGAGLTGGSAALHIADEAKKRGLRVVMIDAGEVAGQASGRNGGNLEAIPENFFGAYGTYDGFAEERYKFLQQSYPHLPEKVLRKQAQRIAETIIKFGYKNAKLTTEDIAKHKLDVDHSLAGWLRLALNPREEKALREEVKLGEKLGLAVKLVSPAQIKKRWKLDTKFYGRVVENNGNFHPFKLVVQEVQRALDQGVQLYTNTKVTKIDDHVVTTERGAIRAGKVIVATNAFTSELFPQLEDIEYFRSQIVNYAHVENHLNGITFTAKDGDIYGNYPKQDWYTDRTGKKRGTLHLGGGQDTRAHGPAHARPTPRVYKLIQHEAKQLLPQLEGKVPVRTWAGPMAFVEGKHGMRMPVIGEIQKDVLVAVWCNGYGSTGCHKTGAEAARWALDGALSPDVPKDVFGIERLLSDDPMFPTTTTTTTRTTTRTTTTTTTTNP
jgi:glycine/D-amino acid oxidase-like deaminating enzyme